MNFGTFQGAGTGTVAGTITRYLQTPVITSSQTIAIPSGTQRIEALLAGGGGGGGRRYVNQFNDTFPGGGGGFGGAAIFEIPVTGTAQITVVIGAGGAIETNGSSTYVISGGVRWAEVGGGGSGGTFFNAVSVDAGNGAAGGGGGGAWRLSNTDIGVPGHGSPPPKGIILWHPYPHNILTLQTTDIVPPTGAGLRALTNSVSASNGVFGGGGGGGLNTGSAGHGGGGNGGATAGIGGGGLNTGGSMASIQVWGYTGGAAGTGGGGGIFGSATASKGGLGGGGGSGANSGSSAGTGGDGAAVIRFYF